MIDPKFYGLIELVIFGAIALGIGFWQLRSVNRDIARSKRDSDQQNTGQRDTKTGGER